jgi:hypothetical protein
MNDENKTENEEIENFGYCDLHEEIIDESTFEWKGCWKCFHFKRRKGFHYYTIHEASKILRKSENTIRRWIKIGKLKGRLFEQGRCGYRDSFPLNIYFIEKESVEKLRIKNQNEK